MGLDRQVCSEVGVAPGARNANLRRALAPPLISAVVDRLDCHQSLLQVLQPLIRYVRLDLLLDSAVALEFLFELFELGFDVVRVVLGLFAVICILCFSDLVIEVVFLENGFMDVPVGVMDRAHLVGFVA